MHTSHRSLQGRAIGADTSALKPTRRLFNTTRPRSRSAQAGFGDVVRSIFDFESWAPRSSRTWRLRPAPGEAQLKGASVQEDEGEDSLLMASLQQRVSELGTGQDDGLAPANSSGSSDVDFSSSFRRRMQDLQAAEGEALDDGGELTGRVLRQMVVRKYGKQYDLSIVKRDIPGRSLVRLNVMWTHLDQTSFPMSEREYDEKLDTIAYYCRAWGQEQVLRDFFSQPPKASRGLPARPVAGSAVSIRLDLSQDVIAEWFRV